MARNPNQSKVRKNISPNGRPPKTWPEPNRGEGHVGEARGAARRIPEDAQRSVASELGRGVRCSTDFAFSLDILRRTPGGRGADFKIP